jgi:hypothetical protein
MIAPSGVTPSPRRVFGIANGAGAETVLCVMVAIPLTIILAALAYRSTLKFPVNPWNEGWIAYHVTSLLSGGPLYYPPDALVTNNYPPLGYYILAPVTLVMGDAVFAGRLVSWLAFAAIAATIAGISWRLNGDQLAAYFASSIFVATMFINYAGYVGMNDPQLLAQAIILAGMWIFVRHSPAPWAAIAAAVLMAGGLFVKHNVVALPVTLTIWLMIFDRRAAMRFVTAGLLTGGAALACFRFAFGPDFLSSMLSPREYVASRILDYPMRRLLPMQIPLLLATLGAVLDRDNRYTALFVGYLVTSIVLAGLLVGGEGVSVNVMFEVVVALSLAAGQVVARMSQHRTMRLWVLGGYVFAGLYNAALLATKDQILMGRWIAARHAEVTSTLEVVRLLSARPGPVLCESSTLCYWSGKPFVFDPFNFQQGAIAGIKDEQLVLRRINAGYYSAIELPGDGFTKPETDLIGPRIRNAIASRYKKVPAATGTVSVFVDGSGSAPAETR